MIALGISSAYSAASAQRHIIDTQYLIFCQLSKFWTILYTNSHTKKLSSPKWNLIVAKVKMATC